MQITPQTVSIIIALLGLISSVWFAQRSIQRSMQDQSRQRENDTARRQEMAIAKAKEETERHVELVNMLHNLADDTKENKVELNNLKDAVKQLNDTQIANNQDLKSAFNRIEKVENRLELLHREHRERAKGGCLTDAELCQLREEQNG